MTAMRFLLRVFPVQIRLGLSKTKSMGEAIWGALAGDKLEVVRTPHTDQELAGIRRRNLISKREIAMKSVAGGFDLRAKFRDMRVIKTLRPTKKSLTIVLDNRIEDPIEFLPGQYLTFLIDIEGEQYKRAYSICSTPDEAETISVTVKRVKGGIVSNWLNDNVKAELVLQTLGPSGFFVVKPELETKRRFAFVAGGVGVTPLYSMARSLLANEPKTTIEFIYGNRSEADVIFKRELESLHSKFSNFKLLKVFSNPSKMWKGYVGRICGELLENRIKDVDQAEWYLCGPTSLMDSVAAFLIDNNVPKEKIHIEKFISPNLKAMSQAEGRIHLVEFAKQRALVKVKDDKPVLEAGMNAGLFLDHSCQMGGCGACKVKVLSGNIEMEEPNCLSQEEIDRGERLICVGYARSRVVLDA